MFPNRVSKLIKSLQLKKYRQAEQSFLVEGAKSVLEVLRAGYEIRYLVGTSKFLEQHFHDQNAIEGEIYTTSEAILGKLGNFQSNNTVLAVVAIPPTDQPSLSEQGYTLLLDGINDPGNLGTILRIADWYGLDTIVASPQTVECYNPKVIQASMGSFTRVNFHHADLVEFCDQHAQLPVYGTFLEGENVHQVQFAAQGLLIMGSESFGISPQLASRVTMSINIPRFGQAESLNVSIATAVVLDNIQRGLN